MKDLSNTIPGYGIYEYQLVLLPHQELRDKIMGVKKDFYDKYQAETARWAKPHVVLVNFMQYQMMEDKILPHFKNYSYGLSSYKN